MKWFWNILDFYIESSIHVALAVVSLSAVYLTKMELPFEEAVLIVNFFATILGYNFVKYAEIIVKKKVANSSKIKCIIILSFFSICFLLYGVFQLNFKALFVITVSSLLTVFYGASVYPIKILDISNKGFRNVPGLKVFVIALVWSLVVVLFPVLQLKQWIAIEVIYNLIEVFLLVVALMIPFEIRDVIYDANTLKTLPQVFGVKRTKFLGLLLCAIIFLIEILTFGLDDKLSLVLIILSVAILCSNESRGKYYCSFFVEAIPILWLFLLLVF